MGLAPSSTTKTALADSQFSEYHRSLNEGRATCEDVVRRELSNVKSYTGKLNAFITIFDGEKGLALSRARELDSRLARGGRAAALFGIPLVMKDNIFFAGFPTTDACYYFRDFIPNANAEIVDQTMALGCVPLGKSNLHELALGGTSAASYFGPVRNPLDPTRVAGGSSGGTAVAVALAKGPLLGLGTDTGGSVRVPAALCRVMGFKPTLGLLSTDGVFPLGATLDHVGLLTRTMPDMIASFESITGQRVPPPTRRKFRVGVPTRHFFDEADKPVVRNFWRSMDRMRDSGRFEVLEVVTDQSYRRFSRARGYIQLREAAWFFEELVNSEDVQEHMNSDVLTLLRRGLSIGLMRYLQANTVRLESIRTFGGLLKGFDTLAMPTTRLVAPKLDDVVGKESGKLRQLLLQNTEVFNLCGFPALSIPSNPGSSALPTAVQFVCRLGEDGMVLSIGREAAEALVGPAS